VYIPVARKMDHGGLTNPAEDVKSTGRRGLKI